MASFPIVHSHPVELFQARNMELSRNSHSGMGISQWDMKTSASDTNAKSEEKHERQEQIVRAQDEAKTTCKMQLPDKPRYCAPCGLEVSALDERGMHMEELELYLPGGFHPVHIGDVLDGRYEVAHKLGCGGFATVWLCWDSASRSWKAVKIIIAEKSTEQCPELKLSKTLDRLDFAALQERHFWIDGPNGRHLALVLPVLGPSIAKTRDMVSSTAALDKICRQLVEAVYCLHHKAICHGDLRPSNVLHRIHSIDSLSKEQLWELLGSPFSFEYYHEVETRDGDDARPHAPKYAVRSVDLRRLKDWIIEDEVAIIDFGVAFKIHDTPIKSAIPEAYAAPELLFEGNPTLSSDIWSLACSILQVQTGTHFDGGVDGAVRYMELLLGPLPENYRQAYAKISPPCDAHDSDEEEDEEDEDYNRELEYYGQSWPMINLKDDAKEEYLIWTPQDLQMKRKGALDSCGYADLLNAELAGEGHIGGFGYSKKTSYTMSRCDVLQLSDLLRKMFKYNPEERLDAAGVMDHPWFSRIQDTATTPDPYSKPDPSPEIEMEDYTKELAELIQMVPKGTRKQRMDLELAVSDAREALLNLIG
ncbi:kinase-like domain-containing protein [Hypomontagnella monticulosa]|nr:kinase-like domain-containing protein [Hypomontagnella monticulosa]